MDNPIGILQETVQKKPSGRLFSYDESTDKLNFLQGNLNFPNGITLIPNKTSLLINEVMTRRIMKFKLIV